MDRIGSILLANAKANVSATSKSSAVEKSDIVGRDLLSLLVKANMATDLKEEQKMSDEDVLARACLLLLRFQLLIKRTWTEIPTFLVAGHETTRYSNSPSACFCLTLVLQQCSNGVGSLLSLH
jgi:hypothetical protein